MKQVWLIADGRTFDTPEEAAREESALSLRTWLVFDGDHFHQGAWQGDFLSVVQAHAHHDYLCLTPVSLTGAPLPLSASPCPPGQVTVNLQMKRQEPNLKLDLIRAMIGDRASVSMNTHGNFIIRWS